MVRKDPYTNFLLLKNFDWCVLGMLIKVFQTSMTMSVFQIEKNVSLIRLENALNINGK